MCIRDRSCRCCSRKDCQVSLCSKDHPSTRSRRKCLVGCNSSHRGASPAWWGFLKADEKSRLQSVINKAQRDANWVAHTQQFSPCWSLEMIEYVLVLKYVDLQILCRCVLNVKWWSTVTSKILTVSVNGTTQPVTDTDALACCGVNRSTISWLLRIDNETILTEPQMNSWQAVL